MKLVNREQDRLTFELRPRERQLLTQLLNSYPVLKPSDRHIARPEHLDRFAAEQQMLIDSLTEQQATNRALVRSFIARHLPPAPDSEANAQAVSTVTITTAEADWLLGVLNDVRIGSWHRMGCPDEDHIHSWRLALAHPQDFTLMEMAGLAQSLLLQSLND